MPRWIPRVFFCLFFYNTSVWIVGMIANGVARLFVQGHSLVLWQLQREHPFARALTVGLVAGFVPLQAWLAASGLMDRRIKVYLRRLRLDRLKPWIAVIYSPILLLALVGWTIQWFTNRSRFSSVLPLSSPYPLPDFFKGFVSTDCSNGGQWGEAFWGDGNAFGCWIHVQMIAAWLFAVGYSFAPVVRKRIMPLFSSEHPLPMDEESEEKIQESTMTKKTDEQ